MYKVLLVDDEYMITEGLKRLIPFEKWDMEVVATANHADDALDYVREHPVDIVISDVNMPDKTGDLRDAALIPGSGRSLGGGHGNPLLCSCLENSMDRGAW